MDSRSGWAAATPGDQEGHFVSSTTRQHGSLTHRRMTRSTTGACQQVDGSPWSSYGAYEGELNRSSRQPQCRRRERLATRASVTSFGHVSRGPLAIGARRGSQAISTPCFYFDTVLR